MRFHVISSGSCGNCYYVENDGQAVFIDMGVGPRTFKKRCLDYGVPVHLIKAILLTHDHADHCRYVGSFINRRYIPVYALPDVFTGIDGNYSLHYKPDRSMRRMISYNTPITLAGMRFTPFRVPHDSHANAGYFVETEGTNLCLMTDVGSFTPEMKEYISRSENLIVEANYDPEMLKTGAYPEFLKDRIASDYGHSSNLQTANALRENLTPKTKRIFLCHLSKENNKPELARKAVQSVLDELHHEAQLVVLEHGVPSLFFDI